MLLYMNIGIFGGSFDPPHKGHIHAAASFIEKAGLDKLFVIPAGIPPHKKITSKTRDTDRLELSRIDFLPLSDKITVSAEEMKRNEISYTVNTLLGYRKRYPDDNIFLLVGTDMFLSFETWREFEKILKICTLAVIPRDNEICEVKNKAVYFKEKFTAQILLLDKNPFIISSTDIREDLAKRRFSAMVSEKTLEYINKNSLYENLDEKYSDYVLLRREILNRLYETLSSKRLEHVLSTEREVVSLCDYLNVPKKKDALSLAALCHDMTRELGLKEQLQLYEKYDILTDSADSEVGAVLHARTASFIAKREFGLSDEICSAIYYHTTGKADMSLEEKILYFADYIEETRKHEACRGARREFYAGVLKSENRIEWLDRCIAKALEGSIKHIAEKGTALHKDTVSALDFLRKAYF